jgi:hypothetical protein
VFVIRIKEKYVPVHQQACGYTCPKCHQKGGLQLTVYQKHIQHVGFSYQVTAITTGSVRCELCHTDLKATDWTDDIEAFYLKTAKEAKLEKTYRRFTWFGKFSILFTVAAILLVVLAFVFNDEIKAHNAARKLADENRQDVVLQAGDKVELRYENLYMTFHQGQDKGPGVQWFEVVSETKKAYKLRKITDETQADNHAYADKNLKKDEVFEMKKAKQGDLGFSVVGLNGAEGLYYKVEVSKVEK